VIKIIKNKINSMRNLRDLLPGDKYDAGGYCPDAKRDFIHKLIKDTNSKFCVEIGVYKGSSLLSFAEALEQQGGRVVGIDPWNFELSKNEIPDKALENYIYNELLEGQSSFDYFFNNLTTIINENNLSTTVSLIRKPAEKAFREFEIESIDILHIDGNHDEVNVSKDIILYLPLVKKGGYIIMDDSCWPGVAAAISKFLVNECEFVGEIGYCLSYYKKK
jgi:predicted O-methyltransferase YrrM